jgi:Mak10 subunit, NatC N(alpha)-terminal acetyltransferase
MDQGFGEDSEDEYDLSRPLLAEEVIGVMDQILCLEVRRIARPRFVQPRAYIPIGWLAHRLLSIANAVHFHLH